MIEIDGSSGGGQMLRTALSLSVIKGEGFRIENIRGKRPNPGLKRQHLEAVKAAKRISGAEVEGDEVGSETLEFMPQELRDDPFTSNIGTAGSITLLYDTVLPITSQFNDSFRLTVKGGTDVKWSPPFSYFKQVKLPLLQKFGVKAEIELEKTGYYPKGGGKATLRTEEYSLKPINITERGELERFEIYSKASKELEDQDVADRQADEAERILKNSYMSAEVDTHVKYEKTASPGSSLVIKAVYENSIAGFDALGERGKRSEKVAKEAVQDFKSFHSSEAAVDNYMADQLLVFLAVVGGEINVAEITEHIRTNMSVIEKFGNSVRIDNSEQTRYLRINSKNI
jgi:RNA 3'-terminal phosphate cyclase (ATP)